MGQFSLLLVLVLLCFASNDFVQSTMFTVVNKCNYTVWPGVKTDKETFSSTGFTLAAGESRTLRAPMGWNGRFWGRTGCKFDDNGRGNCSTGDCGSGQIECNGAISTPPATLAEFKLNGDNGEDFYDVSLVDGFNLPVLVQPKGGAGSCDATGCAADLDSSCPKVLKLANGEGCRSACDAFRTAEYCCTGQFSSPSTCKPTAYTKMFKSACPKAYSYPYDDDATSLFTCNGADYTVAFCPDSIPSKGANAASPGPSPGPDSPLIDSASGHSNKNKKKVLAIVLSLVSGMLLVAGLGCFLWIRRKKKKNATIFLRDKSNEKAREDGRELPSFDFPTIAAATDNFSDGNKLGAGGFGPVYKGKLGEDQEIAVKRLAKTSQQGVIEFKNEVMLIAKLQHRNLVRLLGCCIQGEERMLIYEYMVNKSLDSFLFDKEKAALLEWKTRYQIIIGITRGLLYLHHDSRFRIIHRDLKASNILLDKDMNPKISDFGMARIFGGDETDINTRKVVGTYGYMSSEYALDGNFSMKSDVFSYGVVVLEIISGKKNRGVYAHSPYLNLVAHAWGLWNEGRSSQLVDETVSDSVSTNEVIKCIKIGLLCVQERAQDRPLMSTVIQMLGSDISSLPQPKKPGFIARMDPVETDKSSGKQTSNEMTISLLDGR